ncbi:hypothetical protein J3F83DRAFT_82632 [Trichoderma novae-zelandiae]
MVVLLVTYLSIRLPVSAVRRRLAFQLRKGGKGGRTVQERRGGCVCRLKARRDTSVKLVCCPMAKPRHLVAAGIERNRCGQDNVARCVGSIYVYSM